jgi:hypothetical protein
VCATIQVAADESCCCLQSETLGVSDDQTVGTRDSPGNGKPTWGGRAFLHAPPPRKRQPAADGDQKPGEVTAKRGIENAWFVHVTPSHRHSGYAGGSFAPLRSLTGRGGVPCRTRHKVSSLLMRAFVRCKQRVIKDPMGSQIEKHHDAWCLGGPWTIQSVAPSVVSGACTMLGRAAERRVVAEICGLSHACVFLSEPRRAGRGEDPTRLTCAVSVSGLFRSNQACFHQRRD